MNPDERFERLLAEVLDAGAPSRPPDRLVPETLRAVRRIPRWPRWLAYLKEPPMRVSSRVAVGSPAARITAILAATLLLAVLATGAVVAGTSLLAGPATLVVAQDGSGTHETIADAVAAAQDGDTILVRPGVYTEAVVVDKDVTITGDGPRDAIVIEAPVDGPRVLIEEDRPDEHPYAILLDDTDATVSDLTFRGEPSEVVARGGRPTLEGLAFEGTGIPHDGTDAKRSRHSSIVVSGGSTATIRGNLLRGGGPISVVDRSSPTIEGNTLSGGPNLVGRNMGDGTVFRGNTVTDAISYGIGVHEGNGTVTIEGNVIADAGSMGITAWMGTLHIAGNTVTGARDYGIQTDSAAESRIEGNALSGNGIAIAVARGSVRENSLDGNDLGINLKGSVDVSGNRISGGVTGVAVTSGTPSITDNTISGNEHGLVIAIGTAPALSGNTVCDNGTNLVVPDGMEPPDTTGNEICPDSLAIAAE